jgi:hypothetical protein
MSEEIGLDQEVFDKAIAEGKSERVARALAKSAIRVPRRLLAAMPPRPQKLPLRPQAQVLLRQLPRSPHRPLDPSSV